MKINLQNPQEFTFANVRKMLALGNNEVDMQIRVTNDGIAYLSEITGADEIDGLRFRLHTMDAGNDFIGSSARAATDDIFVGQVYECLKKNWPNPGSTHVDVEPYDFVKLNLDYRSGR